MSKTIKKQLAFLQALESFSPKQRSIFLKHLTTNQVKSLSELVTNLLQPHFPLSKHFEEQLKKQKLFLRQLANPKLTVTKKKQLIHKKGSVIVLIAQATLPFLNKHYATSK